MANRRNIMDLPMVLDRVQTILEWEALVSNPPEQLRYLQAIADAQAISALGRWHALYRDVLIAIAQNKCADPMACAVAALRPGTLVDEAGV